MLTHVELKFISRYVALRHAEGLLFTFVRSRFEVKISMIHDPFKIFLKIQQIPCAHQRTYGPFREGRKTKCLRNFPKAKRTIQTNACVIHGENFSQNIKYNFSEFLYNFITFSYFFIIFVHIGTLFRMSDKYL